jgi:hypothetical protein
MGEQAVTITQIDTGALYVSWAAMGTGDTGAAFHVPVGAKGIAVQCRSALWAGTCIWQASLDGSNWGTLVDYAGTGITFTADGVKFSPVVPMWLRPSMSSNAITLYCYAYVTNYGA